MEWFGLEMNRYHSVIFEIASKYCILDSFVDYEGYSISSKGFLPTGVDIMVSWVQFNPFQSILLHWILKCQCSLLPSPVWPLPIHGPNIQSSYAILFFTALDLDSITSHNHNWALFSLWLRLFIVSGVLSPVFSRHTYWPGSSSFSVISFCLSYC